MRCAIDGPVWSGGERVQVSDILSPAMKSP